MTQEIIVKETEALRSQFVTSKKDDEKESRCKKL